MRYNRTHGMTGTSTHVIWLGMIQRCRDPNAQDWDRYGGRGIKVCERWQSFENFLADMGVRPDGMSVERDDNDGDYTPDNCRWATRSEQQRNRRSNVLLTYNGETLCVAEWAIRTGINRMTLHTRINRDWPVERILTAPVQHYHPTTKEI